MDDSCTCRADHFTTCVDPTATLCAFNLHSGACQLFLNKTRERGLSWPEVCLGGTRFLGGLLQWREGPCGESSPGAGGWVRALQDVVRPRAQPRVLWSPGRLSAPETEASSCGFAGLEDVLSVRRFLQSLHFQEEAAVTRALACNCVCVCERTRKWAGLDTALQASEKSEFCYFLLVSSWESHRASLLSFLSCNVEMIALSPCCDVLRRYLEKLFKMLVKHIRNFAGRVHINVNFGNPKNYGNREACRSPALFLLGLQCEIKHAV